MPIVNAGLFTVVLDSLTDNTDRIVGGAKESLYRARKTEAKRDEGR